MHCESCGATLGDSARFCSACGKPVRREGAPVDHLAESLQRVLPSNFSIVRPLGRGGMGAVYLARDEFLDREVAIKTLPAELGSDGTLRERFRREARIAAKLHHPNIVPLHTFGEAEEILYYVMGYVRGEPLSQRLQREQTMNPEEARRILAEIADALRYANAQSVIHRDLKPENILLDDATRTAYLADFGIARLSGGTQMTRAGAVLGTPLYMSPEQAVGGEVDHRSDIYSLGVIGYRMLTGRFPVSGETFAEMLAQHAARKPPAVSELNRAVPADLNDAIMRCLEKDPDDRWQNAADLRTALAGSDIETAEETPEMQSTAIYIIGFLWLALLLLPFEIFFWRDIDAGWRLLIELVQILPLFGFLALAVGISNARKEKMPWHAIWSSVLRAPRWYWGWTPARFRPRGDAWERLPRFIRLYRILLTFAVLILPVLVVSIPIAVMMNNGKRFLLTMIPVVYGIILPAVVTMGYGRSRLTKAGLKDREIQTVMHTATWILGRSRSAAFAKLMAAMQPAATPLPDAKLPVAAHDPENTPTRKDDASVPATADSESTVAKA